jgi:hypothetical protein
MKKSTGNPIRRRRVVNRTGNFAQPEKGKNSGASPLGKYTDEQLEILWRRAIDLSLDDMEMGPLYDEEVISKLAD